jgi:hypothetical protein
MVNRRSDSPVSSEARAFATAEDGSTGRMVSAAEHDATREGDVIQGLRTGLVFSLAIWAVLLTVGKLVFT